VSWEKLWVLIGGIAVIVMGGGYFWFSVYPEVYPTNIAKANRLAECEATSPNFNRWSEKSRVFCYITTP